MTVLERMEEVQAKAEIRRNYRLIESTQGGIVKYTAQKLMDYSISGDSTYRKWVTLDKMNYLGDLETKQDWIDAIERHIQWDYNSRMPITYRVVYPYEEDLKDHTP